MSTQTTLVLDDNAVNPKTSFQKDLDVIVGVMNRNGHKIHEMTAVIAWSNVSHNDFARSWMPPLGLTEMYIFDSIRNFTKEVK